MVNKDRKDEVRAIIESVFSEAPMANAIDDVKLSDCPFCGATPHRGPTKMQNDQLHGEPFQRYRVWCPKGHASFEEMTEGLAYAAWNTRSPAPSQHTGWSDEAGKFTAPVVGHWQSDEGTEMANRYVAKTRDDIAYSQRTDFELANDIFMVSRGDLELLALQTAAKERIRWLSAQLAALTAASSIAPATGFEVNKLQWRPIGARGSDVEAETVLGVYTMSFDAPTAGGAINLYMAGADVDTFTVFENRRDAEAAAQAHFDAAIRSSISPSVAKESGEP